MHNRLLIIIALSCSFLTNTGDDSGYIGWMRHEGEWVSVYTQFDKLRATPDPKTAYCFTNKKDIHYSRLRILQRNQDGKLEGVGDWVPAQTLSKSCMHALVAIAVAAAGSIAAVALINKYCKKEISKKKAAAFAVGGVLCHLWAVHYIELLSKERPYMLKINRTIFAVIFFFSYLVIPSAISPSRILDGWVWHAQKQIPVYKNIIQGLSISDGSGSFAAYKAYEGNPQGSLAFYSSMGVEIPYEFPCVCEPFSMTCKQVLLTAGGAAVVGASAVMLINKIAEKKISVKKGASVAAGIALATLLYYYKTSGPYVVLPAFR